MQTVPRPAAPRAASTARRKTDRTGTGTLSRVRPPDALRPRRRVSAGHDQEAAPEVDRARAAVVPARRDQRRVPARARRHDLGRVGRCRAASSDPSTACSGAPGAPPDGRTIDQICARGRPAPPRPGLAPHHRQRLERRRARPDGAHALPRAVPVLRGRRPAVLPALPAQRRHLPRRAVQHRLLCAAHAHDRAAVATSRSASSSGPAATATCISTTSSRRD